MPMALRRYVTREDVIKHIFSDLTNVNRNWTVIRTIWRHWNQYAAPAEWALRTRSIERVYRNNQIWTMGDRQYQMDELTGIPGGIMALQKDWLCERKWHTSRRLVNSWWPVKWGSWPPTYLLCQNVWMPVIPWMKWWTSERLTGYGVLIADLPIMPIKWVPVILWIKWWTRQVNGRWGLDRRTYLSCHCMKPINIWTGSCRAPNCKQNNHYYYKKLWYQLYLIPILGCVLHLCIQALLSTGPTFTLPYPILVLFILILLLL